MGFAPGYAANTFQTQNNQQFAEVDELTGGKLKITLHPGGSLYKANEIKRAVQTGQVPSAEFILSGAAGENALYGVDSVPFLATSHAEAWRLVPRPPGQPRKAARFARHEASVQRAVARPVAVLQQAHPGTVGLCRNQDARLQPCIDAHCAVVQGAAGHDQLSELARPGDQHGQQLPTRRPAVREASRTDSQCFYTVNASWLPRNATVVNQSV